jgi:cell division septal protein FtsQ
MAKGKKKSTQRDASSVRLKGRKRSSHVGERAASAFGHFVLPAIVICILLAGAGFLVLSGLETATASEFFALKSVDVRGTQRASGDEIKRAVTASVEKRGVWNADLGDLRTKIEKFAFVRSAAVSRVLPDGIRVNVTERIPAAVVRLNAGKYLVDGEATLLAAVKGEEKEFPFVLYGWDETKTEKAIPDNIARLKIYRKMLEEWKQFDLSSRVKQVNIANPREPIAVVEDSGREISVTLAKDDLGKSLKTAVEALSGKGARVRSVDAGGLYPVINYLEF